MAILKNLLVSGGASRFIGTSYFQDVSIGGTASIASLSLSGNLSVGGTLGVTGEATFSNVAVFSKVGQSTATWNNPALVVGGTADQKHLELCNDTIQGKNNKNTTNNLYLNYYGSNVYLAGSKIYAIRDSTFVAPTANIVTVNAQNINVTNNLRANHYDLQTVAQLGGSFYVSPTVKFPNSGTTLKVEKSDSTLTLTITDSSITSTTMAGVVWAANSRVKVSGTINGVVTGTMDGTVSSINTGSHTLTLSVSGENSGSVQASPSGSPYTASQFSDLTVMIYQRRDGSNDYRVGIWMNCYDVANSSSTIRIYGGSDTNPNVMLGNLTSAGLGTVNNLTPTGWGLFAQNAFLHGKVVANGGLIGNWTIGTTGMYYNSDAPSSTSITMIPGGTAASTTSIGGSSGSKQWIFTGKNLFGIDTDGKLYASSAEISGKITATSGKIGKYSITGSYLLTYQDPNNQTSATCTGFGGQQAFWAGNDLSNEAPFRVSYSGELVATSATITGKITATSGSIAGWAIGSDFLHKDISGYRVGLYAPTSPTANSLAFYIATYDGTKETAYPFQIKYNGKLYAEDADIKGKVTATSGTIGGVTANSSYGLYTNSKTSATSTNTGFLISKDGAMYLGAYNSTNKACPFQVTSAGVLTATSGKIGGWTLDINSIYTGTWGTNGGVLVCTGSGTSKSIGGSSSISGWAFTAGANFGVTTAGALYANSAHITGEVTATSGAIGGFDIISTAIKTKDVAVTSNADNSISLSSADFTRTINSTPREGLRFAIGDKFGVTGDGTIYAGSANISGTLSAGANSTIGPWTVSKTSIYKGSNSINSTSSTAAYFGNDGLSIGGLLKIDARSSAATTISLGNTSSSNISISSSGLMINDNGTSMATFNSDGIEMRGTNGQILLDINTTGDPTSARESFGTSIPAPFTSGQRRVFDIEDLGDHFGNFVGDGQIATSIVENGESEQQVVDYLEKSFTKDFSVSCLNGKATLSYSYSQKQFILTFNQAIDNVSSVGVLFIWVYNQYPHNYTFGTRDNNYDKGVGSATIGHNLINTNANALVVGEYNSDDNYLFAVGNGDNALSRSNAFTVDNYGVVGFSGVAMFGDPANTFVITSHVVVNNASVASLNYKEGTITIERSGYYPLCVAGYNSNTRYLTPTRFYLSDQQSGSGSLHYMIFNPTSSARTGTCTMWVMWVKTT